MAWLKREDKETCQECFQDAVDQNIPTLKRIQYIEQYPCSKHGAPYFLAPDLVAWMSFFQAIAPYCTSQTLPIDLIGRICEEYGLSFVEAFEMLSRILRIWTQTNDHTDESVRHQGSAEISQESSRDP